MLRLALRAAFVLAPLALSGCLFESEPDLLGPTAPGVTAAAVDPTDSDSPLDPQAFSSEPVPTGLNADMLALVGELYEPQDNWWNTKIAHAPLDPNSAQIIATIAGYSSSGGRLHPDFAPDSGIPYCVVDENTPLVPVSFGYDNESDVGAPGAPAGYPIPEEAITNPRYIENEGRSDGDAHMILFDRSQRVVFEMSKVRYVNGGWSANCGAVFKLDSNYRRPQGWTSADAAGLCMLAGLLRYDEVFGPWPIRHALRVSIPRTNGHVYPASHTGASDAGAPPLGTRLRLKKSVDISGYPMHMRKIFSAMKSYGLIVADRGGNMYIHGTMDERWDNGELNPIFRDFDVNDFEVVKLGWKPGS